MAFLSRISDTVDAVEIEIKDWCAIWLEKCLNNLGPLKLGDESKLIDLAINRGGLQFLRDV
jgi:hypothetical protein